MAAHPAAQQQVAQRQICKEARNRQPARGLDRDAGEEEQYPLRKRPHRNRRRRVEVPRHIPVPKQVRANGRIPIPALVGIFRPIKYPWRAVGEVGAQVPGVQHCEHGNRKHPQSVAPAPHPIRSIRQLLFLQNTLPHFERNPSLSATPNSSDGGDATMVI